MLQGKRILVVDDSATMRKKLGKAVTALGHEPSFAENGEDALELVSRQAVDVILLDIEMPGLDGFEVLRRLKAKPQTQHIPVIIISGVEDRMGSIVQALEIGAEDFLPKDFEPLLLKARLSSSLNKKQLHDVEQDYLRLVLDWVPGSPA